ncbi:FkbM family methyltransferase [Iodobacter ciconiae]|uniref:FkbM family methyltransferase n=1 Tax=Iodobacter ciconiae TaxID=2496266 RepID=A0A3S8ZQN4_9NEIS|nr:FkbM family methyltransferase [Iodobacter ciconiae]AZN35789.1 FkbM family methyltransferase [Iodobacter ciconiae]
MKRFYCTYFDKNYLVKAVAMMTSLQRHSQTEVQIFAVCHDEISRVLLDTLQLPGVVTVPMHEIEQGDEALLAAKHSRQLVEYYWTCTPTIILRLLERNPSIPALTYLDADLYFYSDPELIFAEMGEASVLIHEHRFSPELEYLQPQAGRFNVGLLSFSQHDEALSVLKWWRARCNEWCFMHFEAGKMGDQLYLDQWPHLFPFVRILKHIGAGVAPWNHQQYVFDSPSSGVIVDELPLIFYHFHAFSRLDQGFYAAVKHPHYPVNQNVLQHVFVPYMEAIEAALLRVRSLSPAFNFGVNEKENTRLECVLVNQAPAAWGGLDWQVLRGEWQVAWPQIKLASPVSNEQAFCLAPGERLLDYIVRPDMASLIKQVYFVGCHYFEEREWFFSSFPCLEKIYLFEPLPQVYATLMQNFASDPRVRIFPFAISDKDGTATFNVTNNLQSSSLLDLKLHKDIFPYVEKANEVEVVVRSLDSVIREFDLPPPDLLYIDVQGVEYQALQGALELALPHAALVYTEASTIEMYAGAHTLTEVDELLSGLHFKLLGFQDMLGTRVHGDALFINQILLQKYAHPAVVKAHKANLLAQDLLIKGDFLVAEIALKEALGEGVMLAVTQENLGKLSLALGDQQQAVACFAKAQSISPHDRSLIIQWARWGGGQALDACQVFVNQHPGDTAFVDLASFYLNQKKNTPSSVAAQAVESLECAIDLPLFWQGAEWNKRLQRVFVLGAITRGEFSALRATFAANTHFDLFVADSAQFDALRIHFVSEASLSLHHSADDLNLLTERFPAPEFIYFSSAVDAAVALLGFDPARLQEVSLVAIADPAPSMSEGVKVMADYLHTQQFDWQLSLAGQEHLNLALFINQRVLAVQALQRAKARLLNIDAEVALLQGQKKQARDLLDEALELDPAYARTYANWGRYCELIDQQEAALESFVYAFGLDETDRTHALYLSQSLARLGYADEAQGVLNTFIQHFPCDDLVPRVVKKTAIKPRISVLVSTYKSAAFIAECLDDLLAQTVADQIEIIVIDANSPENEGEIVAAYQAKHKNIRYVRTPERIGIYPAWNLAIEMAEGEFLISASTNDRLRADSCERLMQELDADAQLALVYGDSYLTNIAHQQFGTAIIQAGQYWPPYSFELHLHNCMVGCHPMWRKRMHDEFGLFDESYIAIGDQDMWLRMAEKYPLKHIEFVTGLFWSSDESLSGNKEVAIPEVIRVQQLYQQRHAYRLRLKQGALNQADLDFYSQRLNEARRTLSVHLLILDEKGDLAAVARSINSITKQYYQGDLSLTIVSILPSVSNDGVNAIRHQQYTAHPWAEINKLVNNTESDCFGVLRAGDELAIHALLLMLDAFVSDEKLKLVYSNEDVLEKSGLHSAPRIYDHAHVLSTLQQGFASFALLNRQYFLLLQGFKQEGESAALHDYAQHVLAHGQGHVFSHLPDFLYHVHYLNHMAVDQLVGEEVSLVALQADLPRALLLVYIGCSERWSALSARFSRISLPFDLHIITTESIAAELSQRIQKEFPGAYCHIYGNHEQDMVPFLDVVKKLDLNRYEYIGKLHANQVASAEEKEQQGAIWDSLLPIVETGASFFEWLAANPNFGVVAAENNLLRAYFDGSGGEQASSASKIAACLGFELSELAYEYPMSGMFWCRSLVFKGLYRLAGGRFAADLYQSQLAPLLPLLAFERGLMTVAVGHQGPAHNPRAINFEYMQWLSQQQFTRAQAGLIDQHLAQRGEPSICVYIIDRTGDLGAVVKTIQSITDQLYRNIKIAIVSPLSQKDSGGIRWIRASQDHYRLALQDAEAHHFDWQGLLEAGDLLSENGLLLAVQQIVENSHWQLVYFDDDFLNKLSEPSDPRFKPDFNVDLARSIPYCDGFILFQPSILPSLNLSLFEFSEQIDLIFNTFDAFGSKAIGHITEVACHLQLTWGRALDNAQRQLAFAQVVESHLLRRQQLAGIEAGNIIGSLRLTYQHETQPLVSIIIPTKDQLPMLQRCIETLLEKTTYTHYEIIIVDNQSVSAEAKNYLAELSVLDKEKIRVLSYPEAFNFSAINNMAVQAARGEYLVLLNNDTAILQGDWLSALLHHAQRSDVGIVGAKLLFPNGTLQHAGVLLGLCGPAGHPAIGASLAGSGYMHRLQLDQNYSAVTAACLMIRKSVYQQVNGMDETEFKVSYNDIDLCLKVRSLGLLIVWTPYSVVMHEANVSISRIDVDQVAMKEKRLEVEKEAMYRKWLSEIGNDPAYNKNLTLSGNGFELEHRTLFSWQPLTWKPLPVVLCHPADRTGCGQYRILQPFAALLESQLLEGAVAFELFPAFELAKLAPDVMVYQRQISESQLAFLRLSKLYSPSFKVYELDDYLPNIPLKSAHRANMPKDVVKSLRKALTFVDRFVVSTDELANAYQGMHSLMHVVNNYLPVPIWGDLHSERNQGKKPRVGWAGGASHTGDLELLEGVVKALADEVEWVFFGMCPDKLRPFVHEFHSGVPIGLYSAKLASLNLDLALAPLEQNIFNQCKSNLRLLEYGACGFPVVCTDIAPYRNNLPVTRVRNKHKDWVDAIREHLSDPDANAQSGDALKEAVLKDWMLQGINLDKWRAAWLPA